jgi:hypothetical protein
MTLRFRSEEYLAFTHDGLHSSRRLTLPDRAQENEEFPLHSLSRLLYAYVIRNHHLMASEPQAILVINAESMKLTFVKLTSLI